MKKIKPSEGNETFCMAPWTHTHLSPQLERRMCCASREESRTFNQYIDLNKTSQPFNPQTLEEHWNGEYMKKVRVDLMQGKEIPQCQSCNHRLLSVSIYRNHFNKLYEHLIDEAYAKTSDDGHTDMKVTSWDYRFNNLCNFSCRMCGDMLSSSWEAENKKHNDWDPENPATMWMRPEIKAEINKFHDKVIIKEFQTAVESKSIKEIYWCGGEPLMWKIHWETMKRIVELGYEDQVHIRYNSNMSRIDYYGMNLFTDILAKYKYWNILASIDGAGEIGEYIRTGLNWSEWMKNMKKGMQYTTGKEKSLRMDLTMTMPGMLGIEQLLYVSEELGTELLAKRVFGFSPDNIWSPMCLPRNILDRIVDEFLARNKKRLFKKRHLFLALKDLKEKPTYQEEFPDTWEEGLRRGKKRVEKLDQRRNTDIRKILSKDKEVLEWWTNI